MATTDDVTALVQRAEDEAFASTLYEDPIGTLRNDGYDELASDVERELTRIDSLLGKILGDEEFRQLVETQPTATLVEWGMPEPAVVPVLDLIGAPEDVIDRAKGDVELHGKRTQASVASVAAVLGALAFAQSAAAADVQGTRGHYGYQTEGVRGSYVYETEGVRGNFGRETEGTRGHFERNPQGVRVKLGLPQGIRWHAPSPDGVRYGRINPLAIRGNF